MNEISELSKIFELSENRILELIRGKKLSVAAAAGMLGVSKAEIYRLIADGQILAFRLKNELRIPEKSAIDFVARKLLATSLE